VPRRSGDRRLARSGQAVLTDPTDVRYDSPSDTVILIARSILLASKDPFLHSLVLYQEPEILKRILNCGWFDRATDFRPVRQILFGIERLLLPGIIAHYLLRKRRIELAVREAITSGVSQVIVLGAGFDTLAWRLHTEFPQVSFWEIDHHATQNVKHRALEDRTNFHFLPLDLAKEPLAPHLMEYPVFSVERPSIFIAEGLTMYLSAERVSMLLKDIAGLAGHLVFTFMERDAAGSIGFRGEGPLVARWLRWRSEPFLWGVSQQELIPFLAAADFGHPVVHDHEILREQILAPLDLGEIPLACGECICICSPVSR
jgi:methyltransferase (TIGR00027 family)